MNVHDFGGASPHPRSGLGRPGFARFQPCVPDPLAVSSGVLKRGFLSAAELIGSVLFYDPYGAELDHLNEMLLDVISGSNDARAEIERRENEARAEVERKKKIKDQFSKWDGSHIALSIWIKAWMNDPDSYKHVKTTYWDNGDHLIVRTEFRGKNGFGGVVKNSWKAKVDLNGNVIEIIEKGP